MEKTASALRTYTFVALFHQPNKVMQIRMLSLLLFVQSFVACQQNQDVAQSSAANTVLQSSIASAQVRDNAVPSASRIIFKSADGGQTWEDISAGLPKDLGVSRVFVGESEVYLTTEKALYHSSTAAATPNWVKDAFMDVEISDMFSGRTGPYISSYRSGFFKEIPGTGVLIPMHEALKDKTVRSILETPDGTLFVGCESGLYKSADNGKSWKQVFEEDGINSMVEAEGVLICGTYKGLMRSTDGGEHWDWVLTEDGSAWKTGFVEGRFFSITQGGNWEDNPTNRLRISDDGGKTWRRIDEGLSAAQFVFSREIGASPIKAINDLKRVGQYLFCSCDAGIFRSSDWGKSWEPVFAEDNLKLLQLGVSGNVIYAVKVVGC